MEKIWSIFCNEIDIVFCLQNVPVAGTLKAFNEASLFRKIRENVALVCERLLLGRALLIGKYSILQDLLQISR